MPADGISLPPKRDFDTSRWGGSKVKLHGGHACRDELKSW